MILDTIIESDLYNLRELQPEGWTDIVPIFDYYAKMPFCKPVKVMIKGSIVGIGAGISFGNTAWLAHIIVNPEFRKRGIGSLIVDLLLIFLKNSGCETVSLIATDLGYKIYEKAGFVEQTEYVFFERTEAFKDYHHMENIVRYSNTNTEDIFSLDKSVSGEDRRRLLIDKLENSYVYKKNGKIIGYYLPELGDGLIVADTMEAGIELMRLKFSTSGALPVENREGIAFLKENGFAETKRAKRMILGKAFPWQPDKIYNRIGGNLG
ncbi:MAG: N-acetyltransferase [Candidatus Methanoperedenaceae archaeon]|nr:MAG: N-acetyltransferase [Candidatus Methanoperedenaceae archaeon]